MKKALLILVLFAPFIGLAQKQNNMWYFGFNAALDFNSGKPVPIYGSAIATSEGSASIADKNTGNTLFYTDGTSVWDKRNNVMPNGFGLGGNTSSTQSALIVPKPGSCSLYYIFTADAQVDADTIIGPGGSGGISYNVIDMKLHGGLGDVTTLDKLLLTPATEKLCGTFAANRTDVWVLAHEWNSNAFYAYLVTKNGLSAPVISNSGIVHQDVGSFFNAEAIGYMKFSPNSKKLAVVCYSELNTVQIFDFDNSTGIVSSPITDTAYSDNGEGDGPYGASFSPDNSKLYVGYSVLFGVNVIYQYNMLAGDSAAIIASRTPVATYQNSFVAAMANGPDGKMYIAKTPFNSFLGSDSLDVIDSPNEEGSACNFIFNALYLGGAGINQCVNGLPNIIENFPASSGALDIEPQSPSYCFGTGPKLTVTGGGTSYAWSPATGLSASTGNTVHANPPTTTTYTVTSTDSSGCTINATDVLTIFPSPSITFYETGDKKTISFTSDSATGGVTTYTWDFGDSTDISHDANPVHTYDSVRTYYVCLTVYNNSNCSYTRCQYVDLTKTGIQNINGQPDFQLYPNPAGEQLTVNNEQLTVDLIEITNLLGQTVITQTTLPNSKQTIIDVSSLPAGIYLLAAHGFNRGDGMVVKKFVKK